MQFLKSTLKGIGIILKDYFISKSYMRNIAIAI